MVDSRHVENRLLAISPRVIVRLTQHLVCTSRTMPRHTPRDENSNFRKFKGQTAAILKMVSSLYLSRGSSDFKDSHVTKYQNFANSKWRTAAILKIVFGYISTIYCPIYAKWDMKKQNYVRLFINNNFTRSAALAEVCTLQSAILVTNVYHSF